MTTLSSIMFHRGGSGSLGVVIVLAFAALRIGARARRGGRGPFGGGGFGGGRGPFGGGFGGGRPF